MVLVAKASENTLFWQQSRLEKKLGFADLLIRPLQGNGMAAISKIQRQQIKF